MNDCYLGAYESELRAAPLSRRVRGYSDQRVLFPHAGMVRLEPRLLVLGGWRVIAKTAVTGVHLTFTDAYRRNQAAGVRGNAASLGFLGSLGKPLVLSLRDEERVYLLIGFRYFSGINEARRWAPLLASWIEEARPVW